MKTVKIVFAILVLGIVDIGNAMADHRRHNHGGFRSSIVIAPSWGSSWHYGPPPPFYYSPYYYAPPIIIERVTPPVYIERQSPAPSVAVAPAPAPDTGNYWYYCSTSRNYYPYIKDCPVAWQRVSPTPPGQP